MAVRHDSADRHLLSRRAVLGGAGAVLATAGARLPPDAAHAQTTAAETTAAQATAAQTTTGVHRFTAGAAELTVLSDGALDLPPALMLPGRDRASIRALFASSGRTFTGLTSQINVVVIKTGPHVILVDAGGGLDFMPTLGRLAGQLEIAGIKPETITKVVFTHAHADHLWGVIDPLTNDSMFEQAEHLMTAVERDTWLPAEFASRVADPFKSMAIGTHRRLKMIAERIQAVRPGVEIVPGVQIVDTSGHTPGHVSVLVGSGRDQVLIGGDVLIQAVVSFAAPEWRWGPDMDSDTAIATRRRILDQLATDRIRLLGYHLPWPGLGHVARHATAYRFVPA